jgi:hypothetical protein
VVLPGFGGLLLHYAPAQIHPTRHQFLPPHKAITFNKSLTINDGLLISSISNASQIHYNVAELTVEHYVRELNNSLKSKGDFVINSVGKFKLDVEGQIVFDVFEETNYLTDAFGMEHFISPAIMRREAFQPQQAKSLQKAKKKFNWFGLGTFIIIATLIVYQILDITKLLRPFESASLMPDTQRLRNIAIERNEAMHKNDTPAGRRDTLVQIIVIRDETTESKSETTASANSDNPKVSSPNNLIVTKTISATKRLQDSIRYSASTQYPLASEYNPAKWGAFLIVFSSHKSEAAAVEKQKQLINERIGVRLYYNGNEFMVVKSGYMSKQAAAKDVALYSMLGYNNTWLYKMPVKE